jgi:aspartate/methionine/tyrosine aminotransferase
MVDARATATATNPTIRRFDGTLALDATTGERPVVSRSSRHRNTRSLQMTRGSRLPPREQNLFQLIRARRAEAESRGVDLIDLSIGEPRGPALLSAREAAAAAVMSDQEAMHRYQYNASPGAPDFAKLFVESCLDRSLDDDDVAFLPIPGIKRMLGLIPLACGCWRQSTTVGMMTDPGYPFPTDWCAYLGADQYALRLDRQNTFRFTPEDVQPGTQLLMTNYPHNPTGRIVDRAWWQRLCEHSVENDIRIFNDAAYATLAYTSDSCTLTDVAGDYPELSWLEAFSAAKVIGNGTGWQTGAVVGSPDFIADLGNVKGNTDEGFIAPMAVGVLAACQNDQEGIDYFRELYRTRIRLFIDTLTEQGMRLAVEPDAGFFTLWQVPDRAFGEPVGSAAEFNFRMIDESGLIGVHFDPSYIRYAVCADVEELAAKINTAFEAAHVSYA